MGNFGASYKQLNRQQRLAVDAIDGPVLVIAGPGTGKTQLLTTRIANILSKTDTLAENILCLTFTEAAVVAMRERLVNIIGQAAYDVTISTYHSFGSDLIRRYPEYFMTSEDLRPVDALSLDTILRKIQQHLPYSNPLKPDIFTKDIKSLISDAKLALLEPKDLKKIAGDNERFIELTSRQVLEVFAGFKIVSKNSAPVFRKLDQKVSKTGDNSKLEFHFKSSLASALDYFDESGKTTELSKWKSSWLVKDSAGRFIVGGEDQVRKLEALSSIYELYLKELETLKLYDYDDMILRAIKALNKFPDFKFNLQEKYQYLLLDEYQDTNAAQAKIVSLLTDNPINEQRPNVLAVGDDDQAIFAFQGANYSHMLNFYNNYKDVLVVPLTVNYRSGQHILYLADGIVKQIDARLVNEFSVLDKTITAVDNVEPDKSEAQRYEFRSDLSQGVWVAGKIKELVESGVNPSEIAVLSPKHEYLEALVPFIQRHGVPIRYEKRENILNDFAVNELLLMARLVISIANLNLREINALWPAVLSLSIWKLPTSLLWELSWKAAESKISWTEALLVNQQTKTIALFFIRLSQDQDNSSLEQMLDKLIGITKTEINEDLVKDYMSPFFSFYFGDNMKNLEKTEGFWQLLSNLTVLREQIRDYRAWENEPLKLNDLIEYINANRVANIKIQNTNPYQEAIDSVQLMTAYKAKGQEFQAVFIIGAIDEIWGSRSRNIGSRISLPVNLRYIKYAGTTNDERLRLLYVAITRAKTKLFITSYASTFSGKPTTRLKYLDEKVEEHEIISPLLPDPFKVVSVIDQTTPELNDMKTYWQKDQLLNLKTADLVQLLRPRLETFQLSPTQINCFIDIENNGPETFFIQNVLRFPSSPSINAEYGSVIHETIEWIHLSSKQNARVPNKTQIFLTFERKLLNKRLGEPHNSLLLERGKSALSSYVEQRSGTFELQGYNEFNFRNEAVFIGPAHLTGKIDKLIVDNKRHEITIVDFKTGKCYLKWAHTTRLHLYQNQLYLYKLLVENSSIFKGYKVVDAYLEFVEPDQSGKIEELHISFNDQTSGHLKLLAGSVWKHAQSLDFPDTSKFKKDVSGIVAFEDYLIAN